MDVFAQGGSGGGGAENRRAQRYTLMMRVAKLVSPTGEFLCILRDASNTGVRIQVFHAIPDGKSLRLEMPNGARYEVEMVWERDSHAGLRFLNPVEILQVVNDPGPHGKRPVRLAVQLPALISSSGLSSPVVIRNLSQHGAGIECPTHLALAQKLRLESEALPELQATVRWRKNSDYGLSFDQTFRFDELARLVARLQLSQVDGDTPQLEGLRFV